MNNTDANRGFRGEFAPNDAHDMAMSLPIAEVVTRLVDYLGATTVAAIGGVNETRAVAQWMSDDGRAPQRPHVLRFAFQLATMISLEKEPDVAIAWFQGSNPHLGDKAPMMILRDSPLSEIQGPLMAAARAFTRRV